MQPTYKFIIGCKEFIIPEDILNKIPMLKNFMLDSPEGPYIIYRSPVLFEHVLSFAIDDTYKYPAEYYTELDFYDIKYDKSKLHDPFKNVISLLEKSIELSTNVSKNVVKLEKEICEIKNQISITKNISLCESRNANHSQQQCEFLKCHEMYYRNDRFCPKHLELIKNKCLLAFGANPKHTIKCNNAAENGKSYCSTHISGRKFGYCEMLNCRNSMIDGKTVCYLHLS